MSQLETLISKFSELGLTKLVDELKKIDLGDEYTKLAFRVLIDYVEHHGPEGILKAQEELLHLIEGRTDKPLPLNDLALSSEILYTLKRKSAEDRTVFAQTAARVTSSVGPMLAAFLRSLL